jgi:hypothetical protein
VVAAILCESCKCYAFYGGSCSITRVLIGANASSSSYSAQEIALFCSQNSRAKGGRAATGKLLGPEGNTATFGYSPYASRAPVLPLVRVVQNPPPDARPRGFLQRQADRAAHGSVRVPRDTRRVCCRIPARSTDSVLASILQAASSQLEHFFGSRRAIQAAKHTL